MKKKKRRGTRQRARVGTVRPTETETTLCTPNLTRSPVQAIKRSPPARVSELAERHRYALAGVKRSLVIGGAMFILLIILYLILD